MIILGVDLGRARTGLAICDKEELLASPLCVIEEYNRERLLDKIAEQAAERRVEQIVVGLPKNMDGSEGDSAQNARAFAQQLNERAGIETVMSDERGTTLTAHQYLNETNVRGKKRKQTVDAVAATIILEEYLRYRKNTNINS